MQKTISPKTPDSACIQDMFNRLAGRYDLFNHLTSAGLASGWRKETLKPLKPGMRVLDLGCGTGDLALDAAKKLGGSGEVVGLDFSEKMLTFAAKRYARLDRDGSDNLRFVLRKAEELPIEKEPFDLVVSAFVLRNLYENIDTILEGVYQSLKEEGKISFLDITEPKKPFLAFLWKSYMNTFAAFYGKILFGKDYPVFYLTESAERFLKAPDFVRKLERVGFEKIELKSFLWGVITLYQAVKPGTNH